MRLFAMVTLLIQKVFGNTMSEPPVLLKYRSSKWFIMTMVIMALFTVCLQLLKPVHHF